MKNLLETNNSSDIDSVYCSVKQKGFSVARLIQRRFIILPATLVMLSCGVFGRTDPPAISQDTVRPAQVVVIASQPFLTDRAVGFSPAHLRLVLESVRPNLLAVEAPTNIADSWQYAPFDLKKVTKPWANKHNVPMIPIGHLELEYNKQLDAMLKYFQAEGLLKEYQIVDDRFKFAGSAHKYTFKFINSAGYDTIWRNYNSGLHRLYRRNVPAEEINEKIAANVLKLCKASPGKRIAVVINAPSSYYIKDSLVDQPNINFLSIENSLNFSQDKLAAKTLPQDYLYALRILKTDNFSTIRPDGFSRLETFLERIRQYPEYGYDHSYFHGKMFLHRQDPRMAAFYFQNLATVDPKIVLKFDNETPVRDSALVYVAIAKLQMGKKKEAINRLRTILQMADTHQQTTKWIQRILAEILPPEVTVDLDK